MISELLSETSHDQYKPEYAVIDVLVKENVLLAEVDDSGGSQSSGL